MARILFFTRIKFIKEIKPGKSRLLFTLFFSIWRSNPFEVHDYPTGLVIIMSRTFPARFVLQ
jgi:hypothetical protein